MYICLINLVSLIPGVSGGVGRIARVVSRTVLDYAGHNADLQVIFAVNPMLQAGFGAWLGTDIQSVPYMLAPLEFDQSPDELLRHVRPDIIISPVYGVLPFTRDSMGNADILHVAFMPDAQVLDCPEYFDEDQLVARRAIYEALKEADRVVTISEFSRERLMAHLGLLPEQVQCIPLGGDSLADEVSDHGAFRPDGPYLLYPANTWAHKQHLLLLEVMKLIWFVRPELHLVLTGGRGTGADAGILEAIDRASKTTGKVHDLGHVTAGHLKALYEHAEALVFPSSYEGFALPLVEAMSLGCPAICSDTTCIPETVGNAALLVSDWNDPQRWAEAILETLPARRDQLIRDGHVRARQYRWAAAVDSYVKMLREVGVPLQKDDSTVRAAPPYLLIPAAKHRSSARPSAESDARELKELRALYEHYERLRLQSDTGLFRRIPLIGFVLRTFVRMRNLEAIEAARSELYRALLRRQNRLEAHPADSENRESLSS